MSKRLVFFGTEDFSAASLNALITSGYDIAGVVAKPDSPAGRGRQMKSPKVKEIAKTAKIKTFQPQKLTDIKTDLTDLKPDAGVLVAYGKIIPQEIIDIFPLGIVNVHPSLLPKYRGPSPIETALLNGDEKTGVSLMKLTSGMDEGPVYAQEEVEIYPGADRLLFGMYLAERGAEMLQKHLPAILDGDIKPKPQDDSKASYTKLLTKPDGLVVFSKEDAEEIERKVRAYLGYPKTRAEIHGEEVIITGARVAEGHGDGILVLPCREGFIEIQELIAPSGKRMSGSDFLRGYSSGK